MLERYNNTILSEALDEEVCLRLVLKALKSLVVSCNKQGRNCIIKKCLVSYWVFSPVSPSFFSCYFQQQKPLW